MDVPVIIWIILGVAAPILLGFATLFWTRGRERWNDFKTLAAQRLKLRGRVLDLDRRRDAVLAHIRDQYRSTYDQAWARKSRQTSIRDLSEFGASGARFSALEAHGYTTVADLERIIHSTTNLQNIDGVGPTTAQRLRVGYFSYWNQLRAEPLRLPPPEEAEDLVSVYQAAAVATFYEQEIRRPWTDVRQSIDAIDLPGFIAFCFSTKEDLDQRAWDASSLLEDLEPRVTELENTYHQFRSRVDDASLLFEFLHAHTNEARGYLQISPGDGYPPARLVSGIPAITDSAERARDENEFENTVVTRVLEDLRVSYERQYPVSLQVGSRETRGFIDVVIYREDRIISLIESKRSIATENELRRARDQALSYAVRLRVASFAVAAAEGFWVYELPRHQPDLAFHVTTAELRHRAQEIIEAMHVFDAKHLG